MNKLFKLIAAVLVCALIFCGCNILAPTPTEPPTERERIEEAWDDVVIERTVPVEYVALSSGAFDSIQPVFEKPENIQALLDICAKLDVKTLQSGAPTWSDTYWMTMGKIALMTSETNIFIYVEKGKAVVALQNGENFYYTHSLSASLTRGDFKAFWHYIEPAE